MPSDHLQIEEKIHESAEKHGLKVLLCFGGYGRSNGFSAVAPSLQFFPLMRSIGARRAAARKVCERAGRFPSGAPSARRRLQLGVSAEPVRLGGPPPTPTRGTSCLASSNLIAPYR